jgi:hypothetical protein
VGRREADRDSDDEPDETNADDLRLTNDPPAGLFFALASQRRDDKKLNGERRGSKDQ